MTDPALSWRDARKDAPPDGATVLVLDTATGAVRTLVWSAQTAKRLRWWLPRGVLP